MTLFNDIGGLMGMLMQPAQHQESQELANRAGVDTHDFAKIAAVGLPLLLQGMNHNNQNQEGLISFNEALNQHQSRNNYNSLSQFAQYVDTADGAKIVNRVFGGNQERVSTGLAENLGVSSNTVQQTLAVLAPLVLKYLADQKQKNNLGAKEAQKETQDVTQKTMQQMQKYNKTNNAGNNLLGGLLGDLVNSSAPNKKTGNPLEDIFNLFK